ncbi:MAG TPA: GGDEF domain-containing protein [Bdellovibrionota bacterium]|nr:GGDEF domain-containing protein [Bdellovibrionota bacterium]
MINCAMCGLKLDDTDLTRHYLKDPRLVQFIQQTHQTWTPDQGACSRCLENFARELSTPSAAREEITDEQTVITAAEEFIRDVPEEGGASLITIHGVDLGKKFDLPDGDMIIGRGDSSHVRVNEENVSRQHAKLFKQGTEVIIEDLHSTNGTFVNTKKITSHPLKDGDLILVGNTILKFVSGSHVESQYHEEIYRLATIDGLTRIFNKNFFLDKVTHEFGRSKRYRRELTLILFDFDHFKKINDTYGHPCGDFVLQKTGSIIMKNMRKEDVCGRYGGEEFGILLPETSLQSALRLADKIRKLVEGTVFDFAGATLKSTISVGVASLTQDVRTSEQFIARADEALYRAKRDGRNCVRS